MKLETKLQLAQKRRWRIRQKIKGTAKRPRLSLHISNKHFYAQCVDDSEGKTLCFLSSLSKSLKEKSIKTNIKGATKMGEMFGLKANQAGIQDVVFDRGSRRYHGVVKAFADSLRGILNF